MIPVSIVICGVPATVTVSLNVTSTTMLVLIFFQPLDVDDVTLATVGDDVSAATVLVVDVELVVDEDVELVEDVTGVVTNIGGNEVVDVDVVMIG
jgi:hypothetical protein